jgi:hypothetical protein
MPGLDSGLPLCADARCDERLRLFGEVGKWKGHELPLPIMRSRKSVNRQRPVNVDHGAEKEPA